MFGLMFGLVFVVGRNLLREIKCLIVGRNSLRE